MCRLQNREGLFTDDEVKQLDGGYSVSETDDNASAINDLLSQNSILRAVGVNADLYSPGKPMAGDAWGGDNDVG